MYPALWRALPGGTAVKIGQLVVLFAVLVVVLFGWVFPYVSAHLPYQDVTVVGTSTGAWTPPAPPATPAGQ